LAAFYPHPGASLPIWKVVGAGTLLAGISLAVLAGWRRRPYLVVGWLWYLGMLAPVIGMTQAGLQARADRFTYLPQIGLYLALVWGAADVCRCWPYRRWLCGLTPVLLLVALMACAWRQTSFWHDSETLWTHTLACTPRNDVAHCNLGGALLLSGRFQEALVQYGKALEIGPDYATAHQNLGNTLNRLSRFDEALSHYRAAAGLRPDNAQIRAGMGTVLARLGRRDEALAEYAKALEIEPGFAMGHNNMGNILLDLGRQDEALAHYRQAAKINPNFAMAHYNLAKLLVGRGDLDEALWHYQQLVRIDPNSSLAHDGLGAALSRMSRFGESLARCRQLLEVNPRDTAARCNMGAAWAECGQFEKALACYRRAVELQPDSVPAQVKLAWLRATCPLASLRDGREAIEHALQASQLCQDAQAQVLETLAAAYAEAGWFPEAVATANKAVELAERQHDRASAERLRAQLALFQAGKPFHQEPPPALSR
jgi:tetratricopeptide (TPR) repeat protein